MERNKDRYNLLRENECLRTEIQDLRVFYHFFIWI